MPIAVNWADDNKRILLATFIDTHTVADLFAALSEAQRLAGETEQAVYGVCNFTDCTRLASGGISYYPKIAGEVLGMNLRRHIMVGLRDSMLPRVTIMAETFLPLEFVSTMDQARRLIDGNRFGSKPLHMPNST